MKRLTAVLIIILLVSIGFGVYYRTVKIRYDADLRLTMRHFAGMGAQTLIELWKDVDNIFPAAMTEIYEEISISSPEEMETMELVHFRDNLSRKHRWVLYVPLYSEESDSIESYILVSAGIDGKLDNVLPDSVKLHRSDWKQKLKLYNTNEFQDLSVNRPLLHESVFNLRDYWFGKKDLLIFEREQVIL